MEVDEGAGGEGKAARTFALLPPRWHALLGPIRLAERGRHKGGPSSGRHGSCGTEACTSTVEMGFA